MTEVHAKIRLRPLRIGFLVHPTDMGSVKAIMRYCSTVWGGTYNPIIPVFTRPPAAWAKERYDRVRGLEVAKGYIRFFEPDVYVEAESGLLDRLSMKEIYNNIAIYPDVLPLSGLLKPEQHKDWCDPAFGLNIRDVHAHLYRTEQQFSRRDTNENILVKADRTSGVSELIFGVFPPENAVSYIANGYRDAFKPTTLTAGPLAWRKVFRGGAITPLRVTRYGLDPERNWYHDALIFVFDPRNPVDLIDAWNLRLEPRPVLPVPVDWFETLGDDLFDVLKSEHRRIQGNPHNLMHRATVEFSRSIPQDRAHALLRTLKPGLPPGALLVKFWRNSIWVNHHDHDHVHRDQRLTVTAGERSTGMQLPDNGLNTTFQTLSPDFARRYGGGNHRWVNAVTLSSHNERIATVLPFNTDNPDWPGLGMGGERVRVGSEGWIFVEGYKGSSQWIQFYSPEDAIFGVMKQYGFEAQLSEPGYIAKQMLDHLGGLWGVKLLADMETITLLNKMAGGLRTRSVDDQVLEESYALRAAPWREWTALLAKRKSKRGLPEAKLGDFTSKNVIRIGIRTECPNCKAENWNGLKGVDYEITCERCLKSYPFPQAGLEDQNRNWYYRVVGPFSVHDYGRGSYSALLTLRLINGFTLGHEGMTYTTATNFNFDGRSAEVDFIALKRKENMGLSVEPSIVIGECKSTGKGPIIKSRDVSQIKVIAEKIPGAVIVFSILRDHFLLEEKRLLEPIVKWGRRLNADGQSSHPVILLTSNELMFNHALSATWKALGGKYAKFSDYDHIRDLKSLANATQQIYLGLPSFDEWRQSEWEKRNKRRFGESVAATMSKR